MIKIIKKDHTLQDWDGNKIVVAIQKSANRVMENLSNKEEQKIVELVLDKILDLKEEEIPIQQIHKYVENALDQVNPKVARSYRDYRNYKTEFVDILNNVYKKSQSIMYVGDKENSNADSALVSTKRSLIFSELNKSFYEKFFLTTEEKEAIEDGYIYIHDRNARRDSMNCCLFDMKTVLNKGFEMGNLFYTEPNSLDTAFDVISDVVLSAASQQYGGFTIPQVDELLEPYARKSYDKYYTEYKHISEQNILLMLDGYAGKKELKEIETKSQTYAYEKVKREMEQGFQGWEYKFNTVASSRGDYPFITMTFGLSTTTFGKMASIAALETRRKGQGKKDRKKPVLFPKLVFLYDENLHGPGKELEDVFEAGIECSSKTMYPDWLSLTGEGYVSSMYKKYKKPISPMGCVDGQEVITYKYNNVLYVESFERMWSRFSIIYGDKGQTSKNDTNRIIDLRKIDIKIYDTKKGFVNLKYLIRNLQDNWCDVTLTNGRIIRTTTDHPFEPNGMDRIVCAGNLTTKDELDIQTKQYAEESLFIKKDVAWLQGYAIYIRDYKKTKIFSELNREDREIFYRFLNDAIDSNHGFKMHIPNYVFCYQKEAKLSFLAGMLQALGSPIVKENPYVEIQLQSTLKEFSLQQMALAQSLGFKSKIEMKKTNDSAKPKFFVSFMATQELIKEAELLEDTNGKLYFIDYYDITESRVVSVESLNLKQYSYDVTTDSEHFEVSGIYSHNCRAFLSPWYEKGGMTPTDEQDEPIFIGRFNIGAISLHLPMILAKSRQEDKDFYEILDYYLDMIRKLHIRTYEYLGELKASSNPLAFCEGGFYGGHLGFHDKIKPVLKSATASFGITALNELQELYNHKSIYEDGTFALEVMEYINNEINRFKEEDGNLYAIYGTPAENLCGLQIKQFRKLFGVIENVSDRPYVSNSFHCHVTEDINPIQKQDSEVRFWNLFNGGKIQYVRYPISYNKEAIRTLIHRAMDMGLYEGVNLSLAYCDDCGHEELEMDICPICGSTNLTKIDRMNGYLSYSRVKGDTRLNEAKMAEIKDRKSM